MVYLLRVGMSKQYYPNKAYIFGLGHYKPKEEGEDEFSKKLVYFYKFGNNTEFFLEKLIDLYNLRFYDDTIKFDYLTLYPTRFKGGLNPRMVELVKKLSERIGLPYRQVIKRDKDIKPNHGLKSFEERKKNVEGSVDITEDVTNKNIIIIDNTSTTGISLICQKYTAGF